MCIAFILWQCHPRYRLFLALNRDEWYLRPTLPIHWWSDQNEILAGKDLSQGGTWFGCTKNGRIALVTSFREVEELEGAISRGDLVASFFKSSKMPLEYAQEVSEAGDKYNGFNLLVADLCSGSMAYVSNRPRNKPAGAQIILPGFHVQCNGSLNEPWPKVSRGRRILDNLAKEQGPCEIPKRQVLEELLMDSVKADKASLPQTGCTIEWEYDISSILVDCVGRKGQFGTRSMVVFSIDNEGEVHLVERFLEDANWKEHEYCFKIPDDVWAVGRDASVA